MRKTFINEYGNKKKKTETIFFNILWTYISLFGFMNKVKKIPILLEELIKLRRYIYIYGLFIDKIILLRKLLH